MLNVLENAPVLKRLECQERGSSEAISRSQRLLSALLGRCAPGACSCVPGLRDRWRQPEGAGWSWPHTTGSSLAGAGVADIPGSCPQERGLLLSALWDTRLTGLENWKVCQGRKESARIPAPRMPAIHWPPCTPSLSRGFGAGRSQDSFADTVLLHILCVAFRDSTYLPLCSRPS